MILLTDEEMNEVVYERNKLFEEDSSMAYTIKRDYRQCIAKAQLKKVVGWLDRVCEEHPEWEFGYKKLSRSDCPYCWQSLLEEVKEG